MTDTSRYTREQIASLYGHRLLRELDVANIQLTRSVRRDAHDPDPLDEFTARYRSARVVIKAVYYRVSMRPYPNYYTMEDIT